MKTNRNTTIIIVTLVLVIGAGIIPVDARGTTMLERIGDVMTVSDNNENVGIGVENAQSRLSVDGYVESVNGGFKFPDGSIQNTSAIKIMEDGSMCIGFCDDVQLVTPTIKDLESEIIGEEEILEVNKEIKEGNPLEEEVREDISQEKENELFSNERNSEEEKNLTNN